MSAPTAPAERPAGLASPPPSGAPPRARSRSEPRRAARAGRIRVPSWWPTLLIAALLCWTAFMAGGGLNLGRMTAVEMALTLGAALTGAGAVLWASGRRAHGLWPVGLLAAFTALSALSVVWSVQPDSSWQDANRLLAYSAVFALAVVLARALPRLWAAVLGGVILAAVIVCAWALLTKVFPDPLDASDPYARLRAPYGYWNAIGLTAALGAVACMWLGARRRGHALLNAMAYPAMGLLLFTLLMAYSRGALVALAVGLLAWFCIVPLRLRGAAALLAGAAGAAALAAWAFSHHALSSDNVALDARTAAGHQLGVLLVAVLLLLAAVGIAVGFYSARQAPSLAARRRAGAVLLSVLAIAVVASLGALAVSHRGLPGSISHAFHSLTDPHAPVPPNTPGRLTAIASVRARYWNEALKAFKAHPALGTGAEGYATARLRYRTETLDVRHAHGYVVQTLADLGLVGLLLTLALLVSWAAAAGRCTHPFNRRWTSWRTLREWRSGARPRWQRVPLAYTPERTGMLTMLAVVATFGVHSFVDWTWYVPGDACVALLCAGWLAGRGPLSSGAESAQPYVQPDTPAGAGDPFDALRSPAAARPSARARTGQVRIDVPRLGPIWCDRRALAIAGAAVIAALLAAWSQWQPQRSIDASQRALAILARDPRGAEAQARSAVARDPLSAQALLTLATVEQARGRPAQARATLVRAVRLQPSNPQAWLALGEYDLARSQAQSAPGGAEGGPQSAADELAGGISLNPELIAPAAIAAGNREAITVQNDYVLALRAIAQRTPAPAPAPARKAARRARRAAQRARGSARP